MAQFGEVRLLGHTPLAERILFRLVGVADPAHWLHFKYFLRALDGWRGFSPQYILDAGSGRGDYTFYLARRFPNAQVIGVDFDAARVARGQELARALGLTNVTFQRGDLVTEKFERRFDLILSIDVLEHIVEQEGAIRNLRDHLVPGGKFFFHIPTIREKPVLFSGQLASFHEWAEHEHVAEDRTAVGFATVVERAGLSIGETRRTFGRYTGELAVSLFALPHRNNLLNKLFQAMLAPFCRIAAWADMLSVETTRYAVAIVGERVA